jgi:hypothetical protein
VHLEGAPGNPQAVGAHITVLDGSTRRVAQVGSHEGAYLSVGHYRLYFGLGGSDRPVSLEIRWPDGRRQTVDNVAVDRLITVKHPGPGQP